MIYTKKEGYLPYIEIIHYNGVNRLEFNLDSNLLREIILIPKIEISKSFINYPFGTEETNIQTLDFLWLKGKKERSFFNYFYIH